MPHEQHWVFRVLRLFTREEVKTPLSFLFKIVAWLIAALIVILYAPISDGSKLAAMKFVFFCLLGLGAVVLVFAWFRPRHLVYGESGHRAERKLEFGTESRQISREEVNVLPSGSDPLLPRLEDR